MTVFEVSIKVYLLKQLEGQDLHLHIGRLIDKGLAESKEFSEFHKEKIYKNYCWNLLYPIERDNVYKKDSAYTFVIRTIDEKLADFFNSKLIHKYTNEIKALTSAIKIIPQRPIDRIYSITPAIMKNDSGYWKGNMSVNDFERRLKENLIKKYSSFTGEKLNGEFQVYNLIKFLNQRPIATKYKNIKLLGDKIELSISSDSVSQKLAYMVLGTGLLEGGARGFGFMNYQYLKEV